MGFLKRLLSRYRKSRDFHRAMDPSRYGPNRWRD